MSDNTKEILRAFENQASKFDDYQNNVFKNAFCKKAVEAMCFTGEESVLEVAAGTCAFGRLVAPYVKNIIEMDLTRAMLDEGKRVNERNGITNAFYVIGNAENIPYEEESFDAVVTRLSFHHFSNPKKIMSEIARVLKPSGSIAIVDMIPPYVESRDRFDCIEGLRDPSHVRCMTVEEITELCTTKGIVPSKSEKEIIPMNLAAWMDLTDTPASVRKEIQEALIQDLNGEISSGMDPYLDDGHIMFKRHWIYFIGKKQ